jgi:hypothetical protein
MGVVVGLRRDLPRQYLNSQLSVHTALLVIHRAGRSMRCFSSLSRAYGNVERVALLCSELLMIRLIPIDPRRGRVFGTPDTSSLPSTSSLTASSSYSLGCMFYSVDLKDSMLGPKYGCFYFI